VRRPDRFVRFSLPVVTAAVVLTGCGGGSTPATSAALPAVPVAGPVTTAPSTPTGAPSSAVPTATASRSASPSKKPAATTAAPAFRAGNPAGRAEIPAEARAVTAGAPVRTVGTGTPASCTSAAVVAAVAKGGRIVFRCGSKPVTIVLTATAKVRNTSPLVVIDGGGLVTLSGGGKRRILYQDTCDPKQVWTTSHCDDQETPKLVLQTVTFADGNATGQSEEGGGGGAVLARGGQLRIVNSVFLRNRCDRTGPDLGGAAVRALDQWQDRPVYVASSTFGGAAGQGGVCSNGGALSSIGVSWTVLNSVLSYNQAVGTGANPARSGTPGGGSGGAIYNDGNTMTLKLDGTLVEHNTAKEGGGAIFFVSNDRTGSLKVLNSTLRVNPSAGFETAGYPGIFFLGKGKPVTTGSTIR
jgi:predicted outer membrane repeat protein